MLLKDKRLHKLPFVQQILCNKFATDEPANYFPRASSNSSSQHVAILIIFRRCPCRILASKIISMEPSDMHNTQALPDWLERIEGYVRQYCELQQIGEQLSSALRIPSTEETATHMAVRLAAERELQGRKDYLAEAITMAVVQHFRDEGMLSKYPELHTSRSEK